MTEREAHGRGRGRRGVVLGSIAALALVAAVLLPFLGAPLGASEALAIVAIPCAVAALLRRSSRG